jgi:outer membrane biosynthesis protein TonB
MEEAMGEKGVPEEKDMENRARRLMGISRQPTNLSLNAGHVANIACWGFDVEIFTYLARQYVFECGEQEAGGESGAPIEDNDDGADFVGEFEEEVELEIGGLKGGQGKGRQQLQRRRPKYCHAHQLCAHNAKVAARCGLYQTKKVWQVLHFLLRSLHQLATASAAAAAAAAAAQIEWQNEPSDETTIAGVAAGAVASLDPSSEPVSEAVSKPMRRDSASRKGDDGGCDGPGVVMFGGGGALLQELGRANPDAANEMDLAPYNGGAVAVGSPEDSSKNRRQRKKEKRERERQQQLLLEEEEEQRRHWEEENDPRAGGRSNSSRISRERDEMEQQLGWLRDVAVSCLGELLEHCIHEGDVQTAAMVIMVVTIANERSNARASSGVGIDGHGAAAGMDAAAAPTDMGILEGVVEEQRGRQWLLSYIELLQRFELFAQATEVAQATPDGYIRRMNQMSTTMYASCGALRMEKKSSRWANANGDYSFRKTGGYVREPAPKPAGGTADAAPAPKPKKPNPFRKKKKEGEEEKAKKPNPFRKKKKDEDEEKAPEPVVEKPKIKTCKNPTFGIILPALWALATPPQLELIVGDGSQEGGSAAVAATSDSADASAKTSSSPSPAPPAPTRAASARAPVPARAASISVTDDDKLGAAVSVANKTGWPTAPESYFDELGIRPYKDGDERMQWKNAVAPIPAGPHELPPVEVNIGTSSAIRCQKCSGKPTRCVVCQTPVCTCCSCC